MRRLTAGQMVTLPWQWQGPTHQLDEHENEWWELRIAELPEFFVAASTHEEVIAEASVALQAFLESYLSRGESPPLPDLPKLAASEFNGEMEDALEPYARDRALQVA